MNLVLDRSTWERVRFGDVVRNVNETVKDAESAGIDRVIALEHLDPGELKVSRWGDVADGTTFTKRVDPGQTLFGKRRAYQRKAACAEFEAITSGDILVFESNSARLLPELLPFLVQSEPFFAHALDTSAGSLSPRTNWGDLAMFEFDLPLLDEQQRIADLLWAAEHLRRSIQELRAAANRVERRLLEAEFNADWPRWKVAELGGVQLGQQRHPKYADGPNMKPYLRVANVGDNVLDLSDVAAMDFSGPGAEKFRLQYGDILLNEGQSLELVGRAAMFRDEIEDCYMQKTLVRFRSGDGILPEFALAWFRRCFLLGDFAAMAQRTSSMAHLTAVRFAAMPMPRPSIEEQATLVERVTRAAEIGESLQREEAALVHTKTAVLSSVLGGVQ